MSDEEDLTVEELREHQVAQERVARQAQGEAVSEGEAREHERRADKAHYLREKLEAQQRADRDA